MGKLLRILSKIILGIIAVCIYYIIMLVISAYILSMLNNKVVKQITEDWRRVNNKENRVDEVFTDETEESLKKSLNINAYDYSIVVLEKSLYRNTYLTFSTILLIILLLVIILNKDKVVLMEKEVDSKERDIKDKENYWFTYDKIKNIEKVETISENDGLVIGEISKGKSFKVLTLPYKSKLNKHVLLIGSSGVGKSDAYVKTNILNLSRNYSSFVISDPKGEYYKETARYLAQKGYSIKVMDLSDIKRSNRWNPMDDIEDEIDAKFLAEILMEKIYEDNEYTISNEMKNIEIELVKNLVLYVKYSFEKDKQNLLTIHNILNAITYEEIDFLFKDLILKGVLETELKPYLKQFNQVKEEAVRGVAEKLKVLGNKNIKRVLKTTEINASNLKKKPSAYYIILPDTHNDLDVIAATFITKTLKDLMNFDADEYCEDIKNREVYFMLDDFSNFGFIPKFTKMLSRLRSRRLNCGIIIKSVSDLKKIYNDEWQEVTSHCDCLMYYGSNDESTKRYIKDILAKSAINDNQIVKVRNKVANLDIEESIVILRGQAPMLLRKHKWNTMKEYRGIQEKLNLKQQVGNKLKEKFKIRDAEIIETSVNKHINEYEQEIEENLKNVLNKENIKNDTKIKVIKK